MKFNKGKSKVLSLGQSNLRHRYQLDADHLESGFEEEHLGVVVDNKLTMNQRYALVIKKANIFPGSISKNSGSMSR